MRELWVWIVRVTVERGDERRVWHICVLGKGKGKRETKTEKTFWAQASLPPPSAKRAATGAPTECHR